MIDKKYIEELLLYNKGTSLISIWLWSRNYPPFKGDLLLAKNGFFFLAELFMRQKILKLAHNGEFLKGSIEEQLELFREAWPTEYDDDVAEKDIENLWWLLFAPAGAVWIYPDGSEAWT